MKNIIDTIVENSGSLKIFSNTNLLSLLVFLYKNEESIETKEISQFFKVNIDEINKHLLILEKSGLIKKTSKLDKSKKPAFLKSFYKIDENNYKKMLETVKNTVEICLQKTN